MCVLYVRMANQYRQLSAEELKTADDTDYADESNYNGSIRVIRVIRGLKFLR